MTAVLRITSDPADVKRSFGVLVAEARKANEAITHENAKKSREVQRSLQDEQRAAIRSANEKIKADKKASYEKEKNEKDAARKVEAINRNLSIYLQKNEEKRTKDAKRESDRREKEEDRSAKRSQRLMEKTQRLIDQDIARADRKRTQEADRESRKRDHIAVREAREARAIVEAKARRQEQLLRQETRAAERQARNDYSYHRRVQRQQARESKQTERDISGGARNVLGFGVRVAGVVGDYGDSVRQQQAVRDRLIRHATEIAAGDIGDASSASQLTRTTETIARDTGIDPSDVLDAIGKAQADFSALGNPQDRQRYLTSVLPQLARASVATGTSLDQMVGTAGEFQRQFGISNEQLPQAIAMGIAEGRLGSVAFKDTARYMGGIGGRATRFLSTDPADAMSSLAATNALFQRAATMGGDGAESATRVRSFLDNFTSGAGQDRLKELLGHDVLGANGQIVTNTGESQTDAFIRDIEEAWRKSGGNADKFLTGVAGNNTRSRSTGDALIRDLRANGGHLSEYRKLLTGAKEATVADTIEKPFQAVEKTEDVRRGKREIDEMYRQAKGGGWARETEKTMHDIKMASPFLGHLMDNPIGRGILDMGGILAEEMNPQVASGKETNRRQLIHTLARQRAVNEYQEGFFERDTDRDAGIQALSQRIETQLLSRDQRKGIDSNQPITLAPNQTIELGPNTITALRASVISPRGVVNDMADDRSPAERNGSE